MRECIRCGVPITYHHKYCEKCYPHKVKVIEEMRKENKRFRKAINKITELMRRTKKRRVSKSHILLILEDNKLINRTEKEKLEYTESVKEEGK